MREKQQPIASSSGLWYEVSAAVALKKIAMCFRSKQLEHLEKKRRLITLITDSDVLLGKGTKYCRHPGNLRLASFIKLHSEQYDEASKTHNKGMTSHPLQRIKQDIYASICETGRFLKRADDDDHPHGVPTSHSTDTAGWYEVRAEIALKKIAMAFRNHRKRRKP